MLMNLPTELLENVLSFLDPYDLAAFSKTSKFANTVASPSNQILWRHAFLQFFDDPALAWAEMLPTLRAANARVEAEWDWYLRLRERCIALKTLRTNDDEYRRAHLHQSTDALVDIIETATTPRLDSKRHQSSLSTTDAQMSQSIRTLEIAFQASRNGEKVVRSLERNMSSLSHAFNDDGSYSRPNPSRPFTRSMVPDPEPISENSSRLHVYYGLTQHERSSDSAQAAACRIVYDYGHALEENDYGPFMCDGSGHINWKTLEAIASSIGYVFERLMSPHMKIPQSLEYALPYQVGINPTCPNDWAGVTRQWLGTYSFIDYSILHRLNLAFQRGYQPSLEGMEEAHGDLLALELNLDDSIKNDPKLKTELPICDDLPVLYFTGRSQASSNELAFTSARGTASLIPGGRYVRWRFIIRYSGVDQWQLEGVQPGGIRSGGIFGRWTHCDHAGPGPVGPFCYFPSDLCESTETRHPRF